MKKIDWPQVAITAMIVVLLILCALVMRGGSGSDICLPQIGGEFCGRGFK